MSELSIILLLLAFIFLILILIQQINELKVQYKRIFSTILSGLKEDISEKDIIKIIDNIWRLENDLKTKFNSDRIPKDLERTIYRLKLWLEEKGYKYQDFTTRSSDGLNVEVISRIAESNIQEAYILRTLSPEIRFNDMLIRKSRVDIRYPAPKKTFYVTFDTNGGPNENLKTLDFEEGTIIQGLKPITYEGKNFKGWRNKKTQTLISYPFTINDDLDCVAEWEDIPTMFTPNPRKITISYYQDHSSDAIYGVKEYVIGTKVETPTFIEIVNSEVKFLGWKRREDNQIVNFPFEAINDESLFSYFEDINQENNSETTAPKTIKENK